MLATIIINNTLYPAQLAGGITDREFQNRNCIKITMGLSYAEMLELWPQGQYVSWQQRVERTEATPRLDEDGNQILDEDGQPVYDTTTTYEIIDKSAWCVTGPITDNRNGTCSIKMGKRLADEVQAELDEVNAQLANAVTAEELTAAYTEGVNSL